MKHEKSPQCLAGQSRGYYKSGCKTIANPNAKNNAPDHPISGNISTLPGLL
jgi:hypothetical protein